MIGALIVGLAIALELAASPPVWLHILLWPPITAIAVLAALRLSKGILIALEYRHSAREGGISGDER